MIKYQKLNILSAQNHKPIIPHLNKEKANIEMSKRSMIKKKSSFSIKNRKKWKIFVLTFIGLFLYVPLKKRGFIKNVEKEVKSEPFGQTGSY